jgi:hypothetical protein
MWRPRAVYRPAGLAFDVAAFALALLSAFLVVHLGPLMPNPVVVALPMVIVGLFVIARYGAMVFLAGTIAFPLAGLNPALMSFGGADIRASDVLFPVVLLAVLALGRRGALSRQVTMPLGALCLTVIVSAEFVSRNNLAILSALRFVATMTIAGLMVALCRDDRDVTFLLRVTGSAIMVGIGLAFAVGDATSISAERFGQRLLGPNLLGLVSAFLVLLGATQAVYRRRSTRLLLVLSGVVGLGLAKSVGSTLALTTALAVLWGLRNREMRTGRALVAFTVLLAVALALVATFRPSTLPWSEGFSLGSGQQRLIDAYAGLNVFLQHPIVGVGWGESSGAISSPAVISTVRQVFVSANPLLYHDSGVTNAYIQMLAELGLIGGLLLLWLIRNWFRASRALVRAGHPLAPLLGGSLMLFAVWWNETGLFGGQPETFLFAVVLGSVAVACSGGTRGAPGFRSTTPPFPKQLRSKGLAQSSGGHE